MAFKGPYPTVFSGHTAAMVISHTTFSGGVTNAGTIGTGGISVISGAFLSGGGILDTGTILGGIKVDSSSKIVASGTTKTAIAVENANTFGGGISNAGTISAGKSGIVAFRDGTFEGGVTNAGMISAGPFGIIVGQDTIFGGRISNSGRISAGLAGIIFSRITAFASSTAGGIVNGGTITAGETGINVFAAPTFQGGIDNGGTIKAPNGIRLDSVTAFGNASASAGGGITNSGVISGGGSGISSSKWFRPFWARSGTAGQSQRRRNGIHLSSFGVFGSTSAASGIVNSGRIATQGNGIEAYNSGFNGSAFFGGIRNAGTISAGE